MPNSIQKRMQVLEAIGDYILSDDVQWTEAKYRAEQKNPWFSQEMISHALQNIANQYLQKDVLQEAVSRYKLEDSLATQSLGVVNAGNFPLVGFHDFMCAYLAGVPSQIKLSSKDEALFKSIHQFAMEHFEGFGDVVQLTEKLQDCDAYIATGGETSSVYFKKYFGSKPHIIRSHRTSVAILDGTETPEQLSALSDDIHLYYGLGCRSVTHIYVPQGYEFEGLLDSFKNYEHFAEHNKYMNNYDYQLAIYIINGDEYMQRYHTLVVQNAAYSSPVSVVYFSYYEDESALRSTLDISKIQAIVSKSDIAFGQSQSPSLFDFADGEDTFQFCQSLHASA